MLFTFPSRYWFTIGLQRVFSLGGWARRVHTGFHVPRATQDTAGIRQASCKGLSPALAALSNAVPLTCFRSRVAVLQPRRNRNPDGLGCSPFARHYWGNHVLFSLPPGTKMFQFPGFASCIGRIAGLQPAGLPHSEIRGSRVACTYPRLIAACHVFHRLLEPRHPPYALTYFRLCVRFIASAYTSIYLGYSFLALVYSLKEINFLY